jgi:hypothetical protein
MCIVFMESFVNSLQRHNYPKSISRTFVSKAAFYDRSSFTPNARKHDPSGTISFFLILLIVHAILISLTLLHALANGVSGC